MRNLRFERLGFFGLIAYLLFLGGIVQNFLSYVFVSYMLVCGTGFMAFWLKDVLLGNRKVKLPIKKRKEPIEDVAGIIRNYQLQQQPEQTIKAEVPKLEPKTDDALEEYRRALMGVND